MNGLPLASRKLILLVCLVALLCAFVGLGVLRSRTEARKTISLAAEAHSGEEATRLNNRGSDLAEQAQKATGEEGERLLSEAVDAFRQAVANLDRNRFPREWAMTQMNLGYVLHERAVGSMGKESTSHFRDAVAAFRAALDALPANDNSADRNTMLFRIADDLHDLATRAEAAAEKRPLLREAVGIDRVILARFPRQKQPVEWSNAARQLVGALRDLNWASDGEEREKLRNQAEKLGQELVLLR